MPSETNTIWRRALQASMRRRRADDLGRSAVVFSPHQDDETLGCGGTIRRKVRLGAKVKVVYLTDGSRSHPGLMSPEELRSIRHQEALEACQELGLKEGDVFFLDMEDSGLEGRREGAVRRILEVLEEFRPEEVFVTHRDEPSGDHAAANRFVREAVLMTRRATIIWEYPIWCWDGWPWLGSGKGAWRHPWAMAKAMRRGWHNLWLITRCNCSVDVSSELEGKRAALAKHRSQMTRLVDDPRWGTLGEHAEGRFLQMLFQPHEAFVRYELPGEHSV